MGLATGETPHTRFGAVALVAARVKPSVTGFRVGADRLAGWRCGRIVIKGGRLASVHWRGWPYYGNWLRASWDNFRRSGQPDRCDMYYHQPLGMAGFITLDYIRSSAATSLSSLYVASLALDEIARLQGAMALVCHVTNDRISDRLLKRWGWQQHCLDWPGRHYIKRFYGQYPDISPHWRARLDSDNSLSKSAESPALQDSVI
jgi:hypothetical protein